MGPERRPPLAFLFFGVFTGFPELFQQVKPLIAKEFGPLHPRGESPNFPFPETRTYGRTMGPNPVRKFFVLDSLWPEDALAAVKLASIEVERTFRGQFPVERPINIDPGLINDCRIILASTKDRSQRLYRGSGIWEEITLHYEKGAYRAHPWTYADFRSPHVHAFFEPFRAEVIERRRSS